MQNELFESAGSVIGQKSSNKTKDFLDRTRISFRLDQLLIVGIVAVILYAIIYSYGVEKGKSFAQTEFKAEQLKQKEIIQEYKAQLMNKRSMEPKVESNGEPIVGSTATLPIAPTTLEKSGNPEDLAKTPVPKVAKGNYTIQSITYKSDSDADRQIKKLEKIGLNSFVIPSGKYLQVCIEAFESKQQAIMKLRKLKTEGIIPQDAFVRNLPH